MEEKAAIEYLTAPEGKKPSEIGKAVDVLYQKYHSYKAIAQQLNVSPNFLNSRHRIFQLPKGIQWKIDQGQIGITQGYEISRLKNKDDQWLLALAVVEHNLKETECTNVVNIVLRQKESIRDALNISTGVRFDEGKPLMLIIRPDLWIPMSRAAWGQCKNWEDLCYQLIRQGIDVDIKKVGSQLEALASNLREAGREKTK
jgi:hypothetical protein